jgi:hypothetical protein
MLSASEEFQLRKMLETTTAEDNTEAIRRNQHSKEIRDCIEYMVEMKRVHADLLKSDKKAFEDLIMPKVGFLFFNFMPIYNMMLKDVDVAVLTEMLNHLQMIERGECDQHTASVLVGKLLKQMYIDTTLKEIEERDAQKEKPTHLNISYAEYKSLHL